MAHSQDNLEPADLPLDLQLDLLVDEELPEDQRRALLLSLDSNPARWRDLSIRFLERQVEKKSLRQMMIERGALPASPSESPAPANYKFPAAWLTTRRLSSIAAGLLVAFAAAFLTVHFLRPAEVHTGGTGVVAGTTDLVTTPLPGSIWNSDHDQDVQVPVRNVTASAQSSVLPSDANNNPAARRSVIIKSDGNQNALIIPVTSMQYQ